MFAPRKLSMLLLLISALLSSLSASAQTSNFRARLSPLPVTPQTVNSITGGGEVTAVLDGNTLTVKGTFKGLSTVATGAHLHNGPKAIPGPSVHALEISTATAGEINGTITLSADQVAALQGEAMYVQIHSEGNANGEIRGWLLVQK